MSKKVSSFTHIAITAHPKLPEAHMEAVKISDYLFQHNQENTFHMLYDEDLNKKVSSGEVDLLIALGGDGTMLRAGHICGPKGVPILGINMGKFGFLMEIRQFRWKRALPRLLRGEFWLEHRMMLCASHYRGDYLMGNYEVLNEVVVGRGQAVRPVMLVTDVDGRHLTTYVADALIAATATGSTAYAMAAGGPILPPDLRNILLVAVAPHLSIDRAIVLAEGSTVRITVITEHDAQLCNDGQAPIGLHNGDRIDINASENNVKFIRLQDPGYFYRNLTPHMNQNPSTGTKR